MNNRQTGTDYERYVASYLKQEGYRLITANYRTRYGEIDLIAEEGGYLCFIEVKYRSSTRYGEASAAVTPRKQHIISRVARDYLARNGYNEWTPCRFDVAAVSGSLQEGVRVELIRNAFEYQP